MNIFFDMKDGINMDDFLSDDAVKIEDSNLQFEMPNDMPLTNNFDQDDINFFETNFNVNEQIEDVEKLTDEDFFDKQFEETEKQKIQKIIQKVKNNAKNQ